MLSVYLRRSFQRRPLRHLSLFWILMCTFMLPLVVSIYRDSMIYGNHLQKINFSKGQAIHIFGAQPEDAALLRGIDGLTEPRYEDGRIYLNFASEEAWNRYSEAGGYGELNALIKSRLSQSSRNANGIDVTFYRYQDVYGIEEDPLLLSRWRQLQILSLVLLLFSGLIIQSAYRNHIAAFSPELAELAALGATKRQIVGMFLAEFGILFPLAVGCAVDLSYAVMRILYTHYLQQTMGSNIIWRVFHMDPKNTVMHIAVYLLVCFGALGFALFKKPGKRQLRKPGRAPFSLARRWRQQTRPPFVPCLLILVPLITAFVVLFNRYLGSYANFMQQAQSVEISIYAGLRGFKQEELAFVSGLDGIRHVERVQGNYNLYDLYEPGGNTLHGSIYRYQDYAPGEPDLEKNQFVANFPAEFESEKPYQLYSSLNYRGQTSLTLVKRITPESRVPGPVDIYISNALMDELMANTPVTQLNISTTMEYASSLEDSLRSRLPANYQFSNSGSNDAAGAALQVGHLWLLSWIFCILMIVAIQIVWVRLSSYVRECAPMLHTIHHVGASWKQLSRLISIWRAATSAAILPFMIAIPYTWLKAGHLRSFKISPPLAGIYILISGLAALAFFLPVKYSLNKIRKEPK